jgi:tape measure domain-containing protein
MAEATVTRVIEVDVKASAGAAAHLKQISGQLGGIEEQAKKTGSAFGSLSEFVKNTAKGFIGMFVVGEIASFTHHVIQLNDQARILMERMKLVTGNSLAAGDAFLEITRIAREQGREIDGVAKLYEKAARNADTLGLATRGVSVLTEGFAASLRLSGSSTQEANAAMIQFGQALASGKLQGDEFRSLMENNSVFMFELAKAAGVTMGALRDMSKEGKLSSEFLRDALFKLGDDGKNMLQRLMDQAEKLPKTFDQAMSGVKTSLVELLAALNETAGKAEGLFTRMAKAVGDSLSRAARMIREETIVKNAILEARGEKIEGPKSKADQDAEDDLALASRRFGVLQNMQAQQRRAQQLINGGVKEDAAIIQDIKRNIRDMEGELRGLDRVLEDRERKEDLKGAPMLKDKIVGGDDGKKKKGKEAKDWLAEMVEDIDKAEEALHAKEEQWGKNRAKFEENMRKMSKEDWTHGYTFDRATAIVNASRERADQLDRDENNAGLEKLIGKIDREDWQRSIDTGAQMINEWKAKVRALVVRSRRQNPLIAIEEEIEDLRKVANAASTSPEDKASIELLMRDLRERYAKTLMGVKEVTKTVGEEMGDVWENSFHRMEEELLSFSKSTKDILKDLVTTMLTEFARIELRKQLQPLMEAGKQWLIQTIGLGGAANGAAFNAGGVRAFAAGGVVNEPTGFAYTGGMGVMGEAGPEAIMPLQRGADGKLGVGSAPVTVNVINNGSNTNARTEERRDSNGNREILVLIEDVVEGSIGKGRFDKVMSGSFGVTRKGK